MYENKNEYVVKSFWKKKLQLRTYGTRMNDTITVIVSLSCFND
jgi:hypothetical protein